MQESRQRINVVLNELMDRENLSLDRTKLKLIKEYVDKSTEGSISARVQRQINALESLSKIENVQFQSLVEKINGQLSALVNLLKKEKQRTLVSVISGLHAAFACLLNPTLANSTTEKMKLLSTSTICPTIQDPEYMKQYRSWIRPLLDEKKQNFINELMSVPFNDAVRFLEANINDETPPQVLIDRTNDIIDYFWNNAKNYGFGGRKIEFVQYIRLIIDFDYRSAFQKELIEYAKTPDSLSECTLEHFFQKYPSVRDSIFVDEDGMNEFTSQFKLLFVLYCKEVKSTC